MTPAHEIDTTKPFRSMPRLMELVRYVFDTSPDNESDWIEWKCGLELSKASGAFAAAKQIIGFANRDPARAAAHGGGCGFFVLGAEPGNLVGQPSMDPARVEAAIRPYVGTDGPAWLPQTVNVDGTGVVIITVEPPQWGDQIHALRKEYRSEDGKGAKDGEVFVRRPGGTHPATSGELRRLQLRLQNRPADGIELVVHSVGEAIPRVDLTEDAIDTWLAVERRRLLHPMEEAERERLAEDNATRPLTTSERRLYAPALDAMAKNAAQYARIASMVGGSPTHVPEDRTPDEYRVVVDAYIAEARESVVAFALDQFASVVEVRLELRVVNTGERNLESVEVVTNFPGAVHTYEDHDTSMPAPPRPWGPKPNPDHKWMLAGLNPSLNFPRVVMPSPSLFHAPGYIAKNTGSTTIEFDAFDLRPHKAHDLEPVPLIVSAQLEGSITGSWSATATNRDGRAEGPVEVPLSDTVVTIEDLLAETE